MDLPELKLGDVIWEAQPHKRTAVKRRVEMVINREWLTDSDERMESRRYRLNGGVLGLGQDMTKGDWGLKFFATETEARIAAATQADKYEAEERNQLHSEIERLKERIASIGTK